MTRHGLTLLPWLLSAFLATACSSSPTNSPPPPSPPGSVASVVVTPATQSITVGKSVQFTASVRDANNTVVTGRTVAWTSSNPALATVSSTGEVIGLFQGGPVTIQAKVDGITGSATVTVNAPTAPSAVELASVIDSARAEFLRAGAATHDPAQALLAVANRMDTDPRVKSVTLLDSTMIQIELKSGMVTAYRYEEIGADGKSLARGGGGLAGRGGGTLTRFGRAANRITNKKVLFCAAYEKGFYNPGELNTIADIARNAGLGLEVTVLEGKQCSMNAVLTFGNYGLVIIDTHGLPNGFLTGDSLRIPAGEVTDQLVKATLDADNGPGYYEALIAGDIATMYTDQVGPGAPQWWLGTRSREVRWQAWVTSQLVRKLRLPNTVVFGNMCHSGESAGFNVAIGFIQPAFMSTGLASYFGYAYADGGSSKVQNDIAIAMEKRFLRALLVEGDSTFDAHTGDTAEGYEIGQVVGTPDFVRGPGGGLVFKPAGPPKRMFLRQFGPPDYSYVQVTINPPTAPLEYGKPVDFVADDHGSAPANPIYEWDFGDGSPKVRVNGLPLVQHTFATPPGAAACQTAPYTVKVSLLNTASGTPLPVATSQRTVNVAGSCGNWIVTSMTDQDAFFEDLEGSSEFTQALERVLAVPGAGLISVVQLNGTTTELQFRALRNSTWNPLQCCAAPNPQAEYVIPLGRTPAVPYTVGAFFAGWNSAFWSQSTTDVSAGTMTGQHLFGTRSYTIQNVGAQVGPSGGSRLSATRSGQNMTGTLSIWVWWLNEDGEIEDPVQQYRFPFTATRP